MAQQAPEEPLTLEEIQETWPALDAAERIEAFRLLNAEDAQELFLSLDALDRATILRNLPDNGRKVGMRLLAPDDAADVIQESPRELQARLLELLDEKTRQEVKALLSYKEDVAGGLMNPRFARVRPDLSVDEAIRYIRLQSRDIAGVFYVYVLDPQQRLLGVVSLQDLFHAPSEKLVRDVMEPDVVAVAENQDQESIAHLFGRHNVLALPVVDVEGRIKGIITADDILHAVEEEATEDIQKMGGTEAFDRPYLQMGFRQMMQKRAGWLVLLFLGELLTASAMARYEHEIAQAVVLALFLPLIISSGGNSGSQATTLIIRAMALGEVKLRDWWTVMRREISVGFGLGCVLALIGLARILLWQRMFNLYGDQYKLVAISVSLSLLGVVMWGTVAGSMLPLLLRRLGADPASASAPFVATLVDVSGIIMYFTVAAMVLRGTMF